VTGNSPVPTLTGLYCPTRAALLPGTRLNDPLDTAGRVAVLDQCNHRVVVLNASLNPIFAFGAHGVDGNGLGELEYPFGIGMDAQFIYVTDPENHRVQIFNQAGTALSAFGSVGATNTTGDLDKPFDIQPDGQGHLIIADTARSQVLFLTKDPAADQTIRCSDVTGALAAGRCAIVATDGTVYDALVIGGFTASGNELGKFSHPQAVTMDSAGRLLVLDTDGHRVVIFRTAHLTVTNVSVSPAGPWQSGQTATLNVTIANDGASGLLVSPQVSANLGGTLTLPSAAFMDPGQSLVFPVTFLTDASGAVTFTVTAGGLPSIGRAIGSAPVTAGPVTVTAAPAPKLSVAVTATPSRVGVNSQVQVRVEVSNTGNVALTNITPSVDVAPAGLLSAPTLPPAVAAPLALGGTRSYTFTYSALAPGAVTFTARATSTETTASPATVAVTIDSDVIPPVTTVVSVTPRPAASGWYLAPVRVVLAATDNTAVAAINYSVTSSVGFSGRTPGGNATIDLTRDGGFDLIYYAEDAAGNRESPHRLHFDIDATAPEIAKGGVAPAPNAAGWFNQYPTVRFNASDGGSGVAFVTPPVQVLTDGAGQVVTGIARDVAGNSAQTQVTVNVDTKPPTLVCGPTVQPNGLNGWYKAGTGSVTIGCIAMDQAPLSRMQSLRAICPATTGNATIPAGALLATTSCTITAEGIGTFVGEAKDVAGNLTTTTFTVKIDRTPPVLACSVSGTPTVWPPNHKMVAWNPIVTVTDAVSSATFKLVAFYSNENDGGKGDGHTDDDMTGWTLNTPDTSGFVRAERSGDGHGRVYTLKYLATDLAGNTASCSLSLTVPHDQGKDTRGEERDHDGKSCDDKSHRHTGKK
jgi:hypothetical protein